MRFRVCHGCYKLVSPFVVVRLFNTLYSSLSYESKQNLGLTYLCRYSIFNEKIYLRAGPLPRVGIRGQCPPTFLCPPKFCCAQKTLFQSYDKKTKVLTPKNVFSLKP